MPEKAVNSLHLNPWMIRSSPLLHWRFGVLTALVFVGMIVVWSVDGSTIKSFLEAWRLRQKGYIDMKMSSPQANVIQDHKYVPVNTSNNLAEANLTQNHKYLPVNSSDNLAEPPQKLDNTTHLNFPVPEPHPVQNPPALPQNPVPKPRPHIALRNLSWVSAELEPNLTSNLLARWLAPGGEPCKDSKTARIAIPSLDGRNAIRLSAGEIHEVGFQALDESGNPRCIGGDYFESDLSGDSWKSRPLVKDFGNGSYSVSLQVHPDFTGKYVLKLILLYRHFEGLKFSPWRFAVDQQLRRIPIMFHKTSGHLHELNGCKESDFSRDIWSGRWTRLGKNDQCEIGNDGRYRCLAPDFPCRSPWCSGSLGLLESNGWVYSAHCAFRMFVADSAWNCLKNRWIFFWGDSNHVDTIRNMLNFVLDLPEIPSVPRRFDMNFSNPKDPTQSVRITSIFNGHWNEKGNYEGLNSLQDEGFRNLLKSYFSGDTVPDSIIMNSGLHDGVKWINIRAFSAGADYAASFWAGVMESVKQRGLAVPKVFYRTTVATGGYARSMAFNPNKMETFNWVLLEKLKRAGVVSGVIDNFDMTFPWHFDNRCNDGVHYGRAPAKMKWRDGHIGHQYFVDLMLVHVLLNSLCAR